MTQPMISVAGIRGIVGDSLVPEEFIKYVLAFGTVAEGGPVVVGGDSRLSRHMMRHLAFAALQSCGCHVHDIGLAPTPTVGLMVGELKASGGIAISASHNPGQWNAYKFFGPDGCFLTAEANERLLSVTGSGQYLRANYRGLGRVVPVTDAIERHCARILRVTDATAVRARSFRIVVDCVNGVGKIIMEPLLKALGCEVEWMSVDTDSEFPRNPEPIPENLQDLSARVRESGADLGFAIDPDADRLALVDGDGHPIGEERTVVLAVAAVLATGRRGPIVVNLSTTRAIDDVAAAAGVPVYRTPIGEANVVSKMKEVSALIGGEGNGGAILPDVHHGRDAATGAALLLAHLAATGLTLAQFNATIPDYAMVKVRDELEGIVPADVIARMAAAYEGIAELNRTDGVKITLSDRWAHARPSGTEPILRIFAEAPTPEEAEQLIADIRKAGGL